MDISFKAAATTPRLAHLSTLTLPTADTTLLHCPQAAFSTASPATPMSWTSLFRCPSTSFPTAWPSSSATWWSLPSRQSVWWRCGQ